MDCGTLGFPVLHSLLEFAQTHVHWVGDAIFTISPSVAPFFSHPPYLGFGPPSFSTLLTTGQGTQRMCSRHISRLATSLAWQLGDITLARLPPPSMGGWGGQEQPKISLCLHHHPHRTRAHLSSQPCSPILCQAHGRAQVTPQGCPGAGIPMGPKDRAPLPRVGGPAPHPPTPPHSTPLHPTTALPLALAST